MSNWIKIYLQLRQNLVPNTHHEYITIANINTLICKIYHTYDTYKAITVSAFRKYVTNLRYENEPRGEPRPTPLRSSSITETPEPFIRLTIALARSQSSRQLVTNFQDRRTTRSPRMQNERLAAYLASLGGVRTGESPAYLRELALREHWRRVNY